MKKHILLPILFLVGCATLPDNYAEFKSNEEFLRKVVTKNKPLAFGGKYTSSIGPNGTTSLSTKYNDTSNVSYSGGVEPIGGFKKLCADKGKVLLLDTKISDVVVLACGNNNIDFIITIAKAQYRAGFDTGLQYSYDHQISLFTINGMLSSNILDWIVDTFEKRQADDLKGKSPFNKVKISVDDLQKNLLKLNENL